MKETWQCRNITSYSVCSQAYKFRHMHSHKHKTIDFLWQGLWRRSIITLTVGHSGRTKANSKWLLLWSWRRRGYVGGWGHHRTQYGLIIADWKSQRYVCKKTEEDDVFILIGKKHSYARTTPRFGGDIWTFSRVHIWTRFLLLFFILKSDLK